MSVAAVTQQVPAGEPPLLKLVKDAELSPAALAVAHDLPEPEDEGPLYAARRHIYPQGVQGTYRRIKWIVLYLTLGVYYLLPFVRWDRGPDAPGQAVLVDLANSRF
jgi:hypothetical protein